MHGVNAHHLEMVENLLKFRDSCSLKRIWRGRGIDTRWFCSTPRRVLLARRPSIRTKRFLSPFRNCLSRKSRKLTNGLRHRRALIAREKTARPLTAGPTPLGAPLFQVLRIQGLGRKSDWPVVECEWEHIFPRSHTPVLLASAPVNISLLGETIALRPHSHSAIFAIGSH
jgi:hypothetical protein